MDFNPYAAPESGRSPNAKDENADYVFDPSSLPPFVSPRLRGVIVIVMTAVFALALIGSALARLAAMLPAAEVDRQAVLAVLDLAQGLRAVTFLAMILALLFWVYRTRALKLAFSLLAGGEDAGG